MFKTRVDPPFTFAGLPPTYTRHRWVSAFVTVTAHSIGSWSIKFTADDAGDLRSMVGKEWVAQDVVEAATDALVGRLRGILASLPESVRERVVVP